MLSIIIPTLNEEKKIKVLLESLSKQLEPEHEIIIVDGNSSDKTRKIAKSYGAKIVTEPRKGMGYARTLGAKSAKNEILVFIDADCKMPKGFVSRITRDFSEGGIVALAGLSLYEADSRLRWEAYNLLSRGVFYSAKLNHAITNKYWLPANNCAIKKDIFLAVGGYRSVICEETDLMRLLPPAKNVMYDDKLVLTISDRRFRKEGFLRTVALWGWNNILVMAGGGTDTSHYSKEWGSLEKAN